MATKGVTELGPFERCRSCTAELSPGRETCPACGTPVPRSPSNTPSKPRWSTGRKISHAIIAVLVVIVANIYRPHVEPYLRLMWPPWLAPYVGEAISRVEANKSAMALLGESVSHSRFVRGGLHKYDSDSGTAQFRVAVSGAKGEGILQAALAQVDGTWGFSELRLTMASAGTGVDLLDLAEQPARAALETDWTVYLVPLGDIDQEAVGLKELPDFYRKKFNLEVKILPPIPIDENAWDRKRQQLIAEELVNLMQRRLPHLAKDSKAALIGVTPEDMYFRERNWNFAYNFWWDRSGLVSSHRFDEESSSLAARQRLKSRVRKITSRVIGTVVFDLPRSEDPTSVLAKELYGSHSADLMSDEFDGRGSLAVIDGFTRSHWLPAFTPTVSVDADAANVQRGDGSYPCLLARRDRSLRHLDGGWQTKITKCLPQTLTDIAVDEIEIDLRNGSVMTRETDLLVDGSMPLAVTRCYNSWDPRMRTFGYSRGMSWDMYPIGSRNPYTYIDIVLCDARTIYFERISKGGGYADALFEHQRAGSPFAGARFGWTGSGWDLGRADGTHLYFPESYNAKRSVDGALVAWSGPKGAALVIQRDALRNLRQLRNPEGRGLDFKYDALNRVTKVSDGEARSAEYLYDMGGRLVAVSGPYGNRRFKYAGTYLESIHENNRTLFTLRYAKGRASELIAANGHSFKVRYEFDRANDRRPVRTSVIGPNGKIETFAVPADTTKRQFGESQ